MKRAAAKKQKIILSATITQKIWQRWTGIRHDLFCILASFYFAVQRAACVIVGFSSCFSIFRNLVVTSIWWVWVGVQDVMNSGQEFRIAGKMLTFRLYFPHITLEWGKRTFFNWLSVIKITCSFWNNSAISFMFPITFKWKFSFSSFLVPVTFLIPARKHVTLRLLNSRPKIYSIVCAPPTPQTLHS